MLIVAHLSANNNFLIGNDSIEIDLLLSQHFLAARIDDSPANLSEEKFRLLAACSKRTVKMRQIDYFFDDRFREDLFQSFFRLTVSKGGKSGIVRSDFSKSRSQTTGLQIRRVCRQALKRGKDRQRYLSAGFSTRSGFLHRLRLKI